MENILDKLKEILEVDEIDPKSKFEDFEEWDSLTVLTLISVLDSDYGITMNKEQLEGFENIEAFGNHVTSNAR
jgi:acyl carrier protein